MIALYHHPDEPVYGDPSEYNVDIIVPNLYVPKGKQYILDTKYVGDWPNPFKDLQ